MDRQFRDAHIYWVSTHKQFIQGTYVDSNCYGITDMDVLHQMYFGDGNFPDSINREMERLAKKQLKDDIQRFTLTQQAIAQVLIPEQSKDDIFLTIGFNHQTWKVDVCKSVIERVMALPFVKRCEAVFELFRENGEHPHCHFYIETHNKIVKSKVLEKVWAVKDIKKVVLNKNFIDYKVAQPIHKNYVKGIKREDKLQYVKLDEMWRHDNNIPDLFVKESDSQ